MKPLFIALEGIDGSGKSTQTKLLAQKLEEAGHKVYATFEPTDGQIGTILRKILKGTQKADERVIAGLFVADRLDHLLNEENGIVKKLQEGYTVITDRYYFSSYAYHGTHMDMNWVIEANAMSAKVLRPDINIFIDIEPEAAMQRMENRGVAEHYENVDNLRNVRDKYLEAFEKQKDAEHIVTVTGNRPAEETMQEIWEVIQQEINNSST
jgi:dTMP kinase